MTGFVDNNSLLVATTLNPLYSITLNPEPRHLQITPVLYEAAWTDASKPLTAEEVQNAFDGALVSLASLACFV